MSFSLWSFFKPSTDESVTCDSAELALFTRQMSVLFGAGIPLHQALHVLAQGEDVLALRVAPSLAQRVSAGARLSTSMGRFPRVFPVAYVSLIKGAEESGQLYSVLNQLADWLERTDQLRRQVKKALSYPLMVLVVTALLTLALFRTVIPNILEAVLGTGVALPAPTRLLLFIVDAVQSPVTWVLVAAIGLVITGYLRTPEGFRKVSRAAVIIPGLGELLLFSASARLAMTLSMLLRCGAELMRSVEIAARASGLPPIMEDTPRVLLGLREGKHLSELYGSSHLYPPLLRDMLLAGEEAGRVVEMVSHAGRVFEQETSGRMEALTSLLEPIVLAAISLGVGFVIIGVMLPMSTMLSAL